jgi:hypothetical protein
VSTARWPFLWLTARSTIDDEGTTRRDAYRDEAGERMDADEERRWDEEADDRRSRDRDEREAWLTGVETGDYTGWYAKIGRSPSEYQPQSESSPTFTEQFDRLVAQVQGALSGADSLPDAPRSKWLLQIDVINPNQPQYGLIFVRTIIGELVQMRFGEHRPRRQGIDLNLAAQIEFDLQIQRILDRLGQLETWLKVAAS